MAFLGLAAACEVTMPPDGCEPPRGALTRLTSADGPIASIDAGGDLVQDSELFVRVTFRDRGAGLSGLYLDTDGDRTSGMWTYQSSVSASAWNYLIDGGALMRHRGNPTEWNWTNAGTVHTTVHPQGVDLCVPLAALGHPSRVSIAAASGEDWLPHAFLPGASFPLEEETDPPPDPRSPSALAFQYSARPWVLRECLDPDPVTMACPAGIYGQFAHVVFGSGLEEPDHRSHRQAAALIEEVRRAHPGTEVWGYVSLVGGPAGPDRRRNRVHTTEDIRRRADAWRGMGVTGIFLDEADLCRPEWGQQCALGPDGEPVVIAADRQAEVVRAIHELGLAVFANSFSILDTLGPHSPLGPARDGRPADMYLLENPTVSAGERRGGLDDSVSSAKYVLASRLKATLGVRIAAVDTASGAVPDDDVDGLYAAARARAVEAGADAYAFTNPGYSAPPDLATNLSLLGTLPL